MKKAVLALVLLPGLASAQDFIRYYPPASAAGGMADPGADGFTVRTAEDTLVSRTLTSPLGTLAIGNSDGVAGNPTLDVDTSIMGQFSTGAGSFGGTCTPGDWYYETDTFFATFCPVTDTGYTVVALAHAAGTPTDDNTLVGSGTAWEKKALPDCDDATGKHLNYDTTTNAFSCGTSGDGTGAAFDLSTTFTFYDDLTGGTTTASLVGSSGIGFAAVGTGTLTNNIASTAENPGLYRLNSHVSNDNSGAILYMSNNGATVGNIGTMWDGHDWSVDVVAKIGSNATAITNTGVWIGLSNNLGTIPGTNGIFIRRDTDLSEDAFVFVVCNSSGASGCASATDSTNIKVAASSITPTGDVFYRFRIRRLTVGVSGNPTLYFRVNDEDEVTFCSSGCTDTLGTIPAATAMTLVIQFLTRTTTGVMSADVDYLSATVSGLDRY